MFKLREWSLSKETMNYNPTINEPINIAINHNQDKIYMLSSRLLDKNNKEVYMSDVLYDKHFDMYFLVLFSDGKFVYHYNNIIEDLCNDVQKLEVVGNIYQNPELLNKIERLKTSKSEN